MQGPPTTGQLAAYSSRLPPSHPHGSHWASATQGSAFRGCGQDVEGSVHRRPRPAPPACPQRGRKAHGTECPVTPRCQDSCVALFPTTTKTQVSLLQPGSVSFSSCPDFIKMKPAFLPLPSSPRRVDQAPDGEMLTVPCQLHRLPKPQPQSSGAKPQLFQLRTLGDTRPEASPCLQA